MNVKPLITPFGLVLSIFGCVQNIFWFVLSLMGILRSQDAIDGPSGGTFLQLVLHFIDVLFLKEDENLPEPPVNITTGTFEKFLFVYLVLSLVWLTSSLYQSWALFYGKWLMIKWSFITWAVLAIVSSIIDFVLMCMVATDLNWWITQFNKAIESGCGAGCPPPEIRVQIFAVAVVMILALRGFVVWLLNIACAVGVFYVIKSSTQENMDTPIYNDAQGGNNNYLENKDKEPKTPYANPAYVNDEDDEIFDSQSLARNPSFHYQENPWNNNNNNNQTQDNEYPNMSNGKTTPNWVQGKSKINNYAYGSIPRIRAANMSKYNGA